MCTRSRILLSIGLVAVLTLGLNGQSIDPASRFAASPFTRSFTPAVPPASQRQTTVVVKLAGDPVAIVRGRAVDKQISEGQRSAIQRSLRTQQGALEPALAARGVTVLSRFQHAINGIKVRGTAAQIASLAGLPGVVEIKTVATYRAVNAHTVPFIGAPAVWQGTPGLHGEHIRLAIVDTGIDYTHANFGGPGTVAAFTAAAATSAMPADPALFGPNAPKVKGGIDLVGDNYDADQSDPAFAPKPDANPLDCNGHGSHVAGTAAGFGVLNGATFHGPYDAATPSHAFGIGPGVAPLADLYAVRVLGCSGTTNVIVDALDWAVENDMQVVSMSLGASFGTEGTADAEASENLVEAGVVVVAAAGNDGPIPYIESTPASGDKVLSVAAMDSVLPTFPAAKLALNTGITIATQDSNGVAFTDNTALPIVVLRNPDATVSLGCNESEYVDAVITGKLVVTTRGVCDRVLRAQLGFKHGAAAVAMINNAPNYPVFEGDIPALTGGGIVTIPFLGVLGAPATDAASLAAATTGTLSNATLANPSFSLIASFSSQGPRIGDGRLKPDLTAPGTSVVSTGMGTGTGSVVESGTSMATPHVSGVAALTVQAHPTWTADQVALAIANTADPSRVAGYQTRLAGAGLVQPLPATRTWVIAHGDQHLPAVNFGVEEFSTEFHGSHDITLRNLGTKSASFSVSVVPSAGASPHTVIVGAHVVTVGAKQTETVSVTLKIPATTAGDSSDYRDVAGVVRLTPTTASGNGGAALSVPYYLVSRARTEIETDIDGRFSPKHPAAAATVHNPSVLPGTADFYAWGLAGTRQPGLGAANVRAVGVQSFDSSAGKMLVFAVNTYRRWSTPFVNEYDILIDSDGDGVPDFDVFNEDLGLITEGANNGQLASVVLNLATNVANIRFLASAPTDGSTILLPLLASDVNVTSASPRFSYSSTGFDFSGSTLLEDDVSGLATFNAFTSAVSTGAFVGVNPHTTVHVPLAIDPTEWALTPSLGVMVVSIDNFAEGGERQARLLRVRGSGTEP